MGNAEEAIRFINELKSLYEKEGIGILVQDSAGLLRAT